MYSIVPVSPETALDFEPLAPFEVRPVLYDLAGAPRVCAFGATIRGKPLALALAVQGWDRTASQVSTPLPARAARLLTLTVARSFRRLGAGRALLTAIESALGARGVTTLECNYALPSSESVSNLEAFFASTGWEPPTVTMLQCRAGYALLDAPIMRDQLQLPEEYEIVQWVELTRAERDDILARQHRAPWYPATLDPFHFEPELEPLNSLALRYKGEVVGWLITRRTGATTMYYRCLFVREDLAKLGRGLALICNAIERHAAFIAGKPGHGDWSTPTSLPAMIRFIRRHLEPHGTTVTEQRRARKTLTSESADASAVPGPSAITAHGAPMFSTRLRHPVTLPFLTGDECRAVVARVDALRAQWIPRFDTIPFHTLGAIARLDAFDSYEQYVAASRRHVSLQRDAFGELYARLRRVLENVLDAEVEYRSDWAPPALHIVSACPGADLPILAVHGDTQHQYINAGVAYDERPVSFSVLLDGIGSMSLWDLSVEQTIGLDTEETAKLLESSGRESHAYTAGGVFLHASDQFHQVAPLPDRLPSTRRVTLEGHALRDGGRWVVYG